MAKQYQVCDLRPGMGMTRSQSNEHLRNYNQRAYENKMTGNFDPTREHLNFEIVKGEVVPVNKTKSIPQRIKENLASRGIKDPNEGKENPDRRSVANIILQGSRETMLKLAFGDQDVDLDKHADNSHVRREKGIEDWAKDMYTFVAERYGEENIAAFVVHLDEKNPHIHCTLLPVIDNRISWNKLFGGNKYEGQKKFWDLHDAIAAANRKYGLQRGEDIRLTGAKHRTTEEYWQWLTQTCTNLENEIEEKSMTIEQMNKEIRRADRTIKSLNTMLENLMIRKASIEAEIKDLEESSRKGEISNEELAESRMKLLGDISDIESKIADKEEKLKKAAEQLDKLAEQRAKANRQYNDVMQSINKELPTLQERVVRDMNAIGWQMASTEARKYHDAISSFRDGLSFSLRDSFDEIFTDSIFDDLARSGNEIVGVATALFLGYVDAATNYAESHGGGGGGPGGGWGRNKDDDDDDWKRKCFAMARMMMRPQGRRIRKKK